jgi:hypothetical protein
MSTSSATAAVLAAPRTTSRNALVLQMQDWPVDRHGSRLLRITGLGSDLGRGTDVDGVVRDSGVLLHPLPGPGRSSRTGVADDTAVTPTLVSPGGSSRSSGSSRAVTTPRAGRTRPPG